MYHPLYIILKLMNYLNEKYLNIGEKIYLITSGDSGLMCVYSSPPNMKLELLKTKGDIPKNRTCFSICQLDDDNFLLLGGTYDSIYSFEVYQFNISLNLWKQIKITQDKPLPVLVNHEAVTVSSNPKTKEYNIYIIGGFLEFSALNDLLVLTIKNDYYKYKIVKNVQKIQLARVGHSLTLHDSHVYLYGGLDENEEIISSLVDIDFSLYIENPIIKILMKDSLCRRFMHIAYFVDEYFYIAGGYGYHNVKIDNAWKYAGTWSADYIFKAGDRLCAGNGDVYEINDENVPIIVEKKPLSDHLDDIFAELIELYKLTPNVYLNILNKNRDPEDVVKNAVDAINESVSKLEKVERKPQPKHTLPMHVFLSQQMKSKKEWKKWHFDNEIKRLGDEMQLYKQQIELLPPVEDNVLSDINQNFEDFEKELEKMGEKDKISYLLARSSRLVREQQHANAILENLRAKSKRNLTSYTDSTNLTIKLENQLKAIKTKTNLQEIQLLNVEEQRKTIKIAYESATNYQWCSENPSEIDEMKDREQEIIKENQEKIEELNQLVNKYDNVSSQIDNLLQLNDNSIAIECQKIINQLENS